MADESAAGRAVAFFDVDGTLVAGQALWRGVVAYHVALRRRRRRLVPFFLVNGGRILLWKSGRISRSQFIAGWGERLAALFAGLTPAEGREVFAWVWAHTLQPALRADVVALLREHKRAGRPVVLISATLDGLVDVVAANLGADLGVGSRLEVRNGRYTGRVVPPLCFGPHKATAARTAAETLGPVDFAASFAYADSGHDAAFLETCGHPTAVYPDPALHALARERGWPEMGEPQK